MRDYSGQPSAFGAGARGGVTGPAVKTIDRVLILTRIVLRSPTSSAAAKTGRGCAGGRWLSPRGATHQRNDNGHPQRRRDASGGVPPEAVWWRGGRWHGTSIVHHNIHDKPTKLSPTITTLSRRGVERHWRWPANCDTAGAVSPLPQLSSLPPLLDALAGFSATDVELWFAVFDPCEVSFDGCLRLLDEAERARQKRFHFLRDRALYAVAHAMLRVALARHCQHPAERITFAKNQYGRPYVVGPGPLGRPWFNLSHTHGLVACAISQHHQAVGLDVENVARNTEAIEIAERFFSPQEVRALRQLPPSRQRERFFAYWTLKESYIKACGMGLAIPLHHFSFQLDAPAPESAAAESAAAIGIRFAAERHDDPTRWHFRRYACGDEHVVALALASGAGQAPRVRVRRWSPEELT